jgi:hypothetical protein
MLDRGNNLVTKQIEVAEMIYELDKRQLLRSLVVGPFLFRRNTRNQRPDNSIRNPQKAQLVLTDFVFGLKRVPEDQTSTTPLEGGRSQTATFDA